MPRITIITAALNPGPEVRQTIESVLSQGIDDLQYIFVDGGSRPECFAHVAPYAQRIDKLVREPDDGISDAWNKGLALATGDIIGILNADDYLLPGSLQRVLEAFESAPPESIVHGNVIRMMGDTPMVERPLRPLRWMIRLATPVNHPATFVPRSLYDRLGGFDTTYRIAMDYEFILRAYLAGASFIHLDAPVTVFRHGGVSDRLAVKGHAEVRRAQSTHRFNRGAAWLIYYAKLSIRTVAKPLLAAINRHRYQGRL